jgi:hypothetical protein
MIVQANPPIGVVSYLQGYVTLNSAGQIYLLKAGEIIHRDDVIHLTAQGSVQVLMIDGSLVNIHGSLPFNFHDYLLLENTDPQLQDTSKTISFSQPSIESIQHILQEGVPAQEISHAIHACIALEMPMNQNHGLSIIVVPIVENLPDYNTVTIPPGDNDINGLITNTTPVILQPSSEFPLIFPLSSAPAEITLPVFAPEINVGAANTSINTTENVFTAVNNSDTSQSVIVTIVDENNTNNSDATLLTFNPSAHPVSIDYSDASLTFNPSDTYVVNVESATGNTASLALNQISIDGVILSSGNLTLNPLDPTGTTGPYAETYVFQPDGTLISNENSVENAGFSSTAPDGNNVYALFAEAGNRFLNAVGLPDDNFGDFLNAGGVAISPSLVLNGTENGLTSVFTYNSNNNTEYYYGGISDILEIDDGAFSNGNVNIDLTNNPRILSMGEILIADSLNGSDSTTLTLSANDVYNFTSDSNTNNTLHINGGAQDTVNIGSGWTNSHTIANGYLELTQNVSGNTVHLYVQEALAHHSGLV